MNFDDAKVKSWIAQLDAANAQTLRGPLERRGTIVILGWARLALQAAEGSGLNLSVSELCAELVTRGWRVIYLRSGMEYSLRPSMRIEMKEIWRGVGCFSLINSPNLAPGNYNFRNVTDQVDHASQAAMVCAFVAAAGAGVVHAHSLEGFPLSLVGALRGSCRVFITPHNYYYLCPQVDLLAHEREICEDFEGGLRCEDCLSHAPEPAAYRAWRRRYQSAERVMGPHALAVVKERFSYIKQWASSRRGVITNPATPAPPGRPVLLPARREDANITLLAAARRSVCGPGGYGQRRLAGIAALGAATGVLCPSRFLMEVHSAHGVRREVMGHVPLGQPHFDALAERARASPYYDSPAWSPTSDRPLRIAYFGNCYPNKGLATLCAAVELLSDAQAARIQLTIRASGDDAPFRHWMRTHGRGRVTFLGAYDIDSLLTSPDTYDICCFPNTGLENSPFVVLEALHAGRPVIASRLGGPTDFITHGENGLLFPSAHAPALAAAFGTVLAGDWTLPSPRRIHELSMLRTFKDYVDDLEGRYTTALV